MSQAALVVTYVIALSLAAASLAFWWWVMRNGEARFRQGVAARLGVVITIGPRGHWRVTSDGGSWLKHLGIELLQLGYFMGVFVVWALGMLLGVLVLGLVQRVL